MNRIIDLLDDDRPEEAIILFASEYPDLATEAGPIPAEQAARLRGIADQVARISRLMEQLDCVEEQLNDT